MGNARFAYPPKRQMRAFGLVRGGGGRKKRSQSPAAVSVSKGTKVLLWATSPPPAHGDHAPRGASAKGIFGAGDENTGAACLTPDALVARCRRTVVVVARDERSLVEPHLTSPQMTR